MTTANVLLADVAGNKGVSIPGQHSLRQAIALMHQNGKGVVVVLEGRTPVGILTERDAVRLLFTGVDQSESVMSYASRPLILTNGQRTIGYALGLIVENKIRRLIVVDDEGCFKGVVTQQDLLEHMEEDFYRSALKVRHVLNHVKILCGAVESDSVNEALRKMVDGNISAVPIVKNGLAVGIITEKDILRLSCENASLQDPVSRYMSSPVVSFNYEAKLIDIVKVMYGRNIRRVVINNDGGKAVGILTSRDLVRNIDGNYNDFLERKLNSSKDILNLLPEMMFELIDTGQEALVVWANEKAFTRFGRSIIDRPVTELVPADKWQTIYRQLVQHKKTEDVRFKKEDLVFELSGFYMPLDRTDEKGRIQLVLRNITEEFKLASTDPLTNIYNRRYMSEALAKEAQRCKRGNKEFAVVILDIDDFKKVNDNFGHASGDLVLNEVVRVMLEGMRQYDILGRYGGEEFLVLMPEIDKAAAEKATERLRERIANNRIKLKGGKELSVTASFGLATSTHDGLSPDDLLVKADERLYKAKQRGKNQIVS